MKLIFYIFVIGTFFIFQNAYGQQERSDSLLQVYFKEARQKMSEEKYESANNYFKKIFSLKTTLPDEVAYFYGITLLKLKSYVKAKTAFEKYRSLSGEKGDFYSDSKKYIAEADNHICKTCNNTGIAELTDTCKTCLGSGKVAEKCESCKKGMEVCSGCGGKGVFVTKTNFGDSYQTCKNCNGKGFVLCSVCEGTQNKKVHCSNCKGKGIFKKNISCQHK